MHSHECDSKKDYVQFYANKNGETVEYNSECNGDKSNFTYRVEGNKLNTEDESYTIKKLSSHTLILEVNDIDQDGNGKKM